MFKEVKQNNVISFPVIKKNGKGVVFLSANETSYLMIDSEGLSPNEIRDILCSAIHASFGFEENVSA